MIYGGGLGMEFPEWLCEDPDGFIHVRGHRVGLEQIVRCYNEGNSVEAVAVEYPSVPAAAIQQVVAFYLEHRSEVDGYIQCCREAVESQRRLAPPGPSLAELRSRAKKTAGAENR